MSQVSVTPRGHPLMHVTLLFEHQLISAGPSRLSQVDPYQNVIYQLVRFNMIDSNYQVCVSNFKTFKYLGVSSQYVL